MNRCECEYKKYGKCLCYQCPAYMQGKIEKKKAQTTYGRPTNYNKTYYGRKNLQRKGVDVKHGLCLSDKELNLLLKIKEQKY